MKTVIQRESSYHSLPHRPSIEDNETRCHQILECRRQINSWQDKLKRLLVEQERYCKLTKLKCAGLEIHTTWSDLSWSEKQDKDFILVALESNELPHELKSFDEDVFPLHIRTDPEIFMARVHHECFERAFRTAGFVVPAPLCDDKSIMLEVVQRQPLVVKSMPGHWRDDKDIFRHVLKSRELPSELLQFFSKDIRSDAELMLALFQHQESQLSWMRDCSERLLDDKDFLINAVKSFRSQSNEDVEERQYELQIHNERPENQSLMYASQRLRSDFDVVMGCVQQLGLNLHHASGDLRRNEKIVMAACAQNSKASDHSRKCGVPADVERDLLMEYQEFAKSIIKGASTESLKLCLDKYGGDESFCLHSISNRNLEWSMIPEVFRSDANFVAKTAASLSRRLWEALPLEMKTNIQVASAVVKRGYIDRTIIWDVVHKCPEVLSDRNLVMELIARHCFYTDLHPLIVANSVIDIRNDKALMLYAIKHQPRFWEYCSDELRGDRDILMAVAKKSAASLHIVSSTHQLDHPEFVACAIRNHRAMNIFSHQRPMYKDIRREMWHNRAVAMAWLESGGEWMGLAFPPYFTEDKAIIVTATKHFWIQFQWASDMLKSDKAFVIQALAVDARIIRYISKELLFDRDVMMAAFSRDVRAIEFYAECDEQSFAFLVSFAQKIRERLRESRTFQDDFIEAAKCPSPENVDCNLPMLNQGPVMLATYEDKIASYAGILHEEELLQYEATSQHLAAWGM
ncbi:unnamed protein product [Cylindrotheca closterium]|uniref:DUF4116 domain-containing protein n=1 Tax=Cylindrotheca closterium TaxID=2856 RepID=A0AAD2GE58_9STRA|nr:unnamed protein product [Cylindrotheca closterium]